MNRPDEPKAINQPTVMARLNETLGYIATLERHCADLDSSIFGRASQNALEKRDPPSTLEGMMADACSRAASLCGWLGTLKNGLGCPDSVNIPVPATGYQVEGRAITERRY